MRALASAPLRFAGILLPLAALVPARGYAQRRDSVEIVVQVPVSPADSATLAREAAQGDPSTQLLLRARERALAAARAVDTILVTPARLELRVGERFALFDGALSVEARDAAGHPVTSFAPLYWSEPSAVLAITGEGLEARGPGRGRLVIEAMTSDAAGPSPGGKKTVVEVTVRAR